MRILHLTLKKKWFDMIASGEKKEEYREIKKYWEDRLCNTRNILDGFKEFEAVKFTNGYGKNAPSILVECIGIDLGLGMMTWGAEKDKEYFIIQLGELIHDTPIIK